MSSELVGECRRLWGAFLDPLNENGTLSALSSDAIGAKSVCETLTKNGQNADRGVWVAYKRELEEARKQIDDLKKNSERVDKAESEAGKLKTDLSTAQQSGITW